MPDNPSPNKTPSLGLVTNTLLSLSLTAKNVSNLPLLAMLDDRFVLSDLGGKSVHTIGIPVIGGLGLGLLAGFVRTR
ncbi:MAG: hypothetical protein WBZ36_14265 [Candidatus Nitrosopolaris sp.]